MIGTLARRRTVEPALITAAIGFLATYAIIRAIRQALAESYDDGRQAGYLAGANDHAESYARAVRRYRAE